MQLVWLWSSVAVTGPAVWAILRYRRWLYTNPVPDTFKEADELKEILVVFKKVKFLSLVGSWLKLGHRVHLLRRLLGYYFGVPEPPPKDPELKVCMKKFDGVQVKLYQPRAEHEGLRSGMFYIHGGGWTLGSADEMDGVTRALAKQVNMVVASVNYRLAPEYLYPAGLDDCMLAIKYFMDNAEGYGVDSDRVCVAGDSSGGNLAAAVALKLRDESFKPLLKYQVLIYPALQAFDFNTISYMENDEDPYLDKGLMISFWLWYAFGHTKRHRDFFKNRHTSPEAKQRYSSYIDRDLLPSRILKRYPDPPRIWHGKPELWAEIEWIFSDPYFAPLMSKSLVGLPDTYIMTCEQDVLRDEGIIYKRRLEEAEVKVTHEHYKALHALLDMLDMELAQVALGRIAEHLKQHM